MGASACGMSVLPCGWFARYGAGGPEPRSSAFGAIAVVMAAAFLG